MALPRSLKVVPKRIRAVKTESSQPEPAKLSPKRVLKFCVKRIDLFMLLLLTIGGLFGWIMVEIAHNKQAGFSLIENIELRSLDARFRMRGPRSPDKRIVLVGIDQLSLEKFGAYPISRDDYAKLISQLKTDGAAVIALDITF